MEEFKHRKKSVHDEHPPQMDAKARQQEETHERLVHKAEQPLGQAYWDLDFIRHLRTYLEDIEIHGTEPFVTIGQLNIGVHNIIDAIHGREFVALLSPSEIAAIGKPDGYSPGNDSVIYYQREAKNVERRFLSARKDKKRDIERLVATYADVLSIHLPRAEHILLALDPQERHYASGLLEFISSFADTSPEAAKSALDAIDEVDPDTPRSLRLDQSTAKHKVERLRCKQELAELLEVAPEQLDQMPVALVQKVLLRHPFTIEDARQLAAYLPQVEASILPGDIEESAMFAAPVAFFGGLGVTLVLGPGNLIAIPVMLTAMATTVGLWGVAGLRALSGRTPISNLVRKLMTRRNVNKLTNQWMDSKNATEDRVNQLANSAFGRLKLRLAQELVGQEVQTSKLDTETIELLRTYVPALEEQTEARAQFEVFMQTQTEYTTEGDIQKLFEHFRIWQESKQETEQM